jgi:hypothetical protein
MDRSQNYYSFKLNQEFSLESIALQTGVPIGCGEETLISLGFFPIQKNNLDDLFSDPPYTYSLSNGKALREPLSCLLSPWEVKSRVLGKVEEYFIAEIRRAVQGDVSVIEDCVLHMMFDLPGSSRGVNLIKSLKDSMDRISTEVRGSQTIAEVKQVLLENELFDLSA